MKICQLLICGTLIELAYLSFYFFPESPNEVLLFMGVNAFAFLLLAVLYLKARKESPRHNSGRRTVFVILAFAVVFRLTLVFHVPVGSDDIYRYLWDGKVAAHGVNPFLYVPTDSALAPLHTEDLPSKMNHQTMRTIYPPLAQVLFFCSQKIFGDSAPGLKLLLVLADIGTLLLLLQLLKGRKTSESSLLLYAWSPLPVMYFGLDGHIDALGIPFLLLFILLIQRSKHFAAAVSLGFAGLAKLYPLFVAPFLFCETWGRKRYSLPLIPFAMLIVGCWAYWEPTGGLIESFIVFNSHFEFNGSVFHIVYALFKTNSQAHLACSILFLGWLIGVFFLKRSVLEKTFLGFLGFAIFAPVVQPWYLTWLAALLTLRWSGAVFVFLGFSNLCNVTVYFYHLNGVWEDNVVVLLAQYVPFFAILVWEFVKGKFNAPPTVVTA